MRLGVRSFPVSDSDFASHVQRLLADVDRVDADAIVEIEQRVRILYPMARLALQHPLASIGGDRVVYAYREGFPAREGPLTESAAPG